MSLEELERRLEKETHEPWLALPEAMDQDKGTNEAYSRQLARYHAWFSMDHCQGKPHVAATIVAAHHSNKSRALF